MADDQIQRPPFHSSDSVMRVAPAKSARLPAGMPAGPAQGASSGSDPLAELARLIGQNDPFAEYGRAAVAPPAAPAANLNPPNFYDAPAALQPPPMPPLPEAQSFNPPNFSRPPFGNPPHDAGQHRYQAEGVEQRFADPRFAEPHAGAQAGTYDDEPYHPQNAQHGHEEGDYYEEAPPSNRRKSIMVIAGVFALAAIGSAGAFGYRAYFSNSSPSAPPPVIKAELAPSKIVPASNKDNLSKQINDRVNAASESEKLVSREEKPVEIKETPAGAVFPPAQNPLNAATPAPGSGVVSPDAKRVRTIVIRPDQATQAESMPTVAQPAAPVPPPRVTPNTPLRQAAAPAAPQQQQQPPQPQQPPVQAAANAPPAIVAETVTPPAQRQPVARVTPAAAPRQAAAGNAPLSLSPDAPAPARVAPVRAAAPPMRTAAAAAAAAPAQQAPAAPAAAASSGAAGGYAVQVSSQRSEAEAQAAFRAQQSKYPDQLGNKQPLIHRVDLGAKGIYYRVMVGPYATGSEASQLCSSLKAAGGQCIIQHN